MLALFAELQADVALLAADHHNHNALTHHISEVEHNNSSSPHGSSHHHDHSQSHRDNDDGPTPVVKEPEPEDQHVERDEPSVTVTFDPLPGDDENHGKAEEEKAPEMISKKSAKPSFAALFNPPQPDAAASTAEVVLVPVTSPEVVVKNSDKPSVPVAFDLPPPDKADEEVDKPAAAAAATANRRVSKWGGVRAARGLGALAKKIKSDKPIPIHNDHEIVLEHDR